MITSRTFGQTEAIGQRAHSAAPGEVIAQQDAVVALAQQALPRDVRRGRARASPEQVRPDGAGGSQPADPG